MPHWATKTQSGRRGLFKVHPTSKLAGRAELYDPHNCGDLLTGREYPPCAMIIIILSHHNSVEIRGSMGS